MTFSETWAPRALSLLRIMAGAMFALHGYQKVFGWPPSPHNTPFQLFSMIGVAGALELFGGLLIVVGLFTRPVAFVLSGLMAAAYFIGHAAKHFLPTINQGELAVLYCFIFLYLWLAGGGAWSLDRLMKRDQSI